MEYSTPTKKFNKKRAANVFQRGINWARDSIARPSSRPSSPRPTTVAEANNSPGSSALAGPNIPAVPGPNSRPNTTHLAPGSSPDPSDVPEFDNSALHAPTTRQISCHMPSSDKASGIAWNVLKTVLRVLEKSADVFPPLKSVVGGLLACVDVVEAASGNRDEYVELSAELATMAATLERVSKLTSEDRDGSIACILQSIKAEATHIDHQQAHGQARRTFESLQDKEDVLKRFRRIESLFRRLQSNVTLRTWDTTRKLHERSLLQGLSSVDAARYDSSYSTTIKRRACTAETRKTIRQDLEDWSIDPNGAKVYWMNGMAGTGKTTILYSLCKWLEEDRRLGGNFFCSPCTILISVSNGLCEVLDDDPDAAKRDINHQFKNLILKPIIEVRDSMPEGVIVVVDALDECDDSAVVRLLLGLILDHAVNLPIKFIVTSRPEPAVRDKMLAPGFSPSVFHLHDIEKSIVEADITKYLAEELRAMSPSPSFDQLEQLAKRSGRLFIYAATAVRYIHPDSIRVDSGYRLETVLKAVYSSESSKQYKELDLLYTNILSATFNDDLEDRETKAIRLVLQTAICAMEPMSVPTLALLLGLKQDGVKIALEPLRSVLHLQERSGLVSALHASFPDYMFDSGRSGEKFYCDRNQHNQVLANGCFDVMKSQLRFNICNLESSFVFDNDIIGLGERIDVNISRGLSYACRYWGEHLRGGTFTHSLHEKLVDFLAYRLLFWMEVLNLEGHMAMGGGILQQAQSWLESYLTDTRKQVADAEAFVIRYTAGACTRSTPHIYISALPFCTKSSSVYENYWKRARGLIYVGGRAAEQRSKAAIATWATDLSLQLMAFSPDGTQIVSNTTPGDTTIQVWDARSSDVVAEPFEGHTQSISSVAFSLDGIRVVSGSWDNTIRVWDARTGKTIAGPFEGHTSTINSVAFSPDGACIVSGSSDGTVRVWDAQTGNAVGGSLEGHRTAVTSVKFSPDGALAVSGSWDKTIRVWDARSGDTIAGPFEGHTDSINSVAFSPDGSWVVSGSSDNTVRVWDAWTGNIITGPFEGHTSEINSVAFSPDGTQIVSGSDDQTIRVWDTQNGHIVAGPFEGHTSSVTSVAFSPDGTRIFSGSRDKTIRVWDAQIGDAVAVPLESHTQSFASVAFSPDGACVVSGSYNKSVLILDARTGDTVAGPLEGHTQAVSSVAFSPDSAYVVSGSYDATIRIWDARTDNMVSGPFEGHTLPISSVAFSPDGDCVISGSWDKTIRVWDARTGDVIVGPFEGHTDSVNSVSLSTDGTRIVSGSLDTTVRVWDAQNGHAVAGPFEGHTKSVDSVAFSPDSAWVVSGSSDNTIRVWDMQNFPAAARIFEGHTDSVTSVAFSPDGAHIVSGSYDKIIRVWDARTGNSVAGLLEGHKECVASVAFSPDGSRIVSGSWDSTIRVWDVRTGDTTAEPFEFDAKPLSSVAFSADTITDISLKASPRALSSRADNISSYVANSTFNKDGWRTAYGVPLFWVLPHFNEQMPDLRNILVIGPRGPTTIDYHDLHIGDTWSKCFC